MLAVVDDTGLMIFESVREVEWLAEILARAELER
jgi:hypothetical protein